jgi:mannose-6-phosphate isomerase-like protein (cupin superfamily)
MTSIAFHYRDIPAKKEGDPKQSVYSSANYHVWLSGPTPVGDRNPMHNHTADETFFCAKGEGIFSFPDQPPIKVTEGMIIVIPAGEFYQVEATGAEPMVLWGTRAEPDRMPRFTEKGEVMKEDKASRYASGANY